MKRKGYYHTKSLLPSEGKLIAQIRVSSKLGTSIETGSSESLNVLTSRKFMLSKVLTQCVFGHLKKKNFDSYRYLNNNSGDQDFVDALNLKVQVVNYVYAYPKYQGQKRFKTINFRGKRYVQEWTRKGNRYVYSSRTKVKYDNRKRLSKLADDYKMV